MIFDVKSMNVNVNYAYYLKGNGLVHLSTSRPSIEPLRDHKALSHFILYDFSIEVSSFVLVL